MTRAASPCIISLTYLDVPLPSPSHPAGGGSVRPERSRRACPCVGRGSTERNGAGRPTSLPFPFRGPARNLKRPSLNPPHSLPLPSFHRIPLGNELSEIWHCQISDNSIKQGGRLGLIFIPGWRGGVPSYRPPFPPAEPHPLPLPQALN